MWWYLGWPMSFDGIRGSRHLVLRFSHMVMVVDFNAKRRCIGHQWNTLPFCGICGSCCSDVTPVVWCPFTTFVITLVLQGLDGQRVGFHFDWSDNTPSCSSQCVHVVMCAKHKTWWCRLQHSLFSGFFLCFPYYFLVFLILYCLGVLCYGR